MLDTLDEFAERVRMIGQDPVASPQEMLTAASIKVAARGQTMHEMIQETDTNLLTVIKEIRAAARAADEHDDPGTVDLFSKFVQIHEKHDGGCATYLKNETDCWVDFLFFRAALGAGRSGAYGKSRREKRGLER